MPSYFPFSEANIFCEINAEIRKPLQQHCLTFSKCFDIVFWSNYSEYILLSFELLITSVFVIVISNIGYREVTRIYINSCEFTLIHKNITLIYMLLFLSFKKVSEFFMWKNFHLC